MSETLKSLTAQYVTTIKEAVLPQIKEQLKNAKVFEYSLKPETLLQVATIANCLVQSPKSLN